MSQKKVLPDISLKDEFSQAEIDLCNKEPIGLVQEVSKLRASMKKKLKKIDRKFHDYVFLNKPVYERNGQTLELQGTIHTLPKEAYSKINQDIKNADESLTEGITPSYETGDSLLVEEQELPGYELQHNHLETLEHGTINIDITENEYDNIISSKLSETEYKIYRLQSELGGIEAAKFPHKENNQLRKITKIEDSAESVEFKFTGKAERTGVFSDEKIKETANLNTEELGKALAETILDYNAWVIQINETNNDDFFHQLIFISDELFNPLKYLWIKNGQNEKLEWLQEQLMPFSDPQKNIDSAVQDAIINIRDHKAINALNAISKDKKNIHMNYGQAHLRGMHQNLMDEGWIKTNQYLTPVKLEKPSWWNLTKETIKKPFWKWKHRKKRRELKKLLKQAEKENQEEQIEILKQVEEARKNKKPDLKLEKTDKSEESTLPDAA